MTTRTTKQAAKDWGVPHRTVLHWCKSGRIAAERHGWAWVVLAEEPPDDYTPAPAE